LKNKTGPVHKYVGAVQPARSRIYQRRLVRCLSCPTYKPSRQAGRQAGRQTDRQAGRQTNRQTVRQM